MSNNFCDDGYLGAAPELKYVDTDEGKKAVTKMSIYFYRLRADGNGGFQKAPGGFWLDAEVWGIRAERAAEHLRKGAAVHVVGELVEESWTDKTSGEERSRFKLRLDNIFPSLSRIEEISFKEKRSVNAPTTEDAPYSMTEV